MLVFCETHLSHELGECCRFYLLQYYYIILILWASSVSIFSCFNYRKVDHQFICLMFLLRRRKIMMGLDMQKVLFKWTVLTCTKIFTWQSNVLSVCLFLWWFKKQFDEMTSCDTLFHIPITTCHLSELQKYVWCCRFFFFCWRKKNCQHSVVLKLDEAVMDHILW